VPPAAGLPRSVKAMGRTTVGEKNSKIRLCSVLQFVVVRVVGWAITQVIVLALILRAVDELGGMIAEFVFWAREFTMVGLLLVVAYTLARRFEG
jgi:hypothetical protein